MDAPAPFGGQGGMDVAGTGGAGGGAGGSPIDAGQAGGQGGTLSGTGGGSSAQAGGTGGTGTGGTSGSGGTRAGGAGGGNSGGAGGVWTGGSSGGTGVVDAATDAPGKDTGACTSSLECRGRSDGKSVCNAALGTCVACLTVDDCVLGDGGVAGKACVNNACVAKTEPNPDAGTLACKGLLCIPNQPVCNGRVSTRCNDSGTGFLAGGTDCSTTGLLCNALDGTCQAQACTPDQRYCAAGATYKCASDGKSATVDTVCSSKEYCDSALGSCMDWVCTPGAAVCNGTNATTCNADGSGPAPGGVDCSEQYAVCRDGACQPQVCAPESYTCDGNLLRGCSPDGMASGVMDICPEDTVCNAEAMGCTPQLCTPNQPVCDGKTATRCLPNGLGYVPGGTDCTALGQGCVGGLCVNRVCTAGKYFCDAASGELRFCSRDGMAWATHATCTEGQACVADTTMPGCHTISCTANQATCDGDRLTTCNAAGTGFAEVGTDCTRTCTMCAGGACVLAYTEEVGKPLNAIRTASAQTYVLDAYAVTVNRTLTEIEQYLGFVDMSQLFFLVLDCGSGPSVTCIPVATKSLTAHITSGFMSSGPMSVPLSAGHRYLVGAWWNTSAKQYYYFESTTPARLATSFGSLQGALQGSTTSSGSKPVAAPTLLSYPSGLNTNLRFPQRLHTAP